MITIEVTKDMWGRPCFPGRYNCSNWIFNNSDYTLFQHSVTSLQCMLSVVSPQAAQTGCEEQLVTVNGIQERTAQHQPALDLSCAHYARQSRAEPGSARLHTHTQQDQGQHGRQMPPPLWNSSGNGVTILSLVTRHPWEVLEIRRNSSMRMLRFQHSCFLGDSIYTLQPSCPRYTICKKPFLGEPRLHRKPKI